MLTDVSAASRETTLAGANPTVASLGMPVTAAGQATMRHGDRRTDAVVFAGLFEEMPLEDAVDYIVDECFFTVGQAIGDCKTLDVAAVIWLRDHYRRKFLNAMRRFGNRWCIDERRVKGVGRLLAARALEHAGDSPCIDRASAVKAATDAERYCSLHFARQARQSRPSEEEDTWIAGYWCAEGLPLSV